MREPFFLGMLAVGLLVRLGGDQGGQQNVPETIETDGVQVVVGEVESETAPEVLDTLFEFTSAQSGDGCYGSLETSTRIHGSNL